MTKFVLKRFLSLVLILALCTLVACGGEELPSGETPGGDASTGESGDGAPETYTVRFLNEDGSLLSTQEVSKGKSPIPPTNMGMHANSFFKGWSRDPRTVTGKANLTAEYVDLGETTNAIGYDAIYCKAGEEFTIHLRLAGQVELSCLGIKVSFGDALSFVGVDAYDPEMVYHYNEDNETLRIAMASGENITAQVDLCTMRFRADQALTDDEWIQLIVEEIMRFDSQGELVTADSTILCGTICIMEEN